ncbi:hypothetical protein ACLOJK_037615 [Asimina triloba]
MNASGSDSTIVALTTGLKLKKQLSVLVVDDNRVNRKIVMMMLAKLGVPAQEAENGQEAVNLHIAGARFDLILIDMEMPVMDGPQSTDPIRPDAQLEQGIFRSCYRYFAGGVLQNVHATRILRSMGVQCKMVGVSGNTRPSEMQEFMEAGVDEYHVKPMTRPKLICLLQQIDHAAAAA